MDEQNTVINIILSIIAIVISITIIILYYKKKISAIDALIYGFITQSYNISFVGPTISPLFIISYVFFIDEFLNFFIRKISLNRSIFILIFLPIVSSVVIFIVFFLDHNIFEIQNYFLFFTKPFYFYFKQYLPLFAVGYKVYKEKEKFDVKYFIGRLKKVGIFVCYIALLQLLVYLIFENYSLNEILGNKERYFYNLLGLQLLRVQAFFVEPKLLAAFLGLVIPLYIRDKELKKTIFALFIGILTFGATLPAILISAFVSLIVFAKIGNVRLNIFFSLILVILMFLTLSKIKDYFLGIYLQNNKNVAIILLLQRSVINRYDFNDFEGNNELLGIPLQGDLEVPIKKYFTDYPFLLLSGYGPANDAFISPNYWYGEWNYDRRLKGKANHMDLRWLNYIAQFGIITFFIFLVILTDVKSDKFYKKYYAFLLIGFIFIDIDIFVIIMFALMHKGNKYSNQLSDN